MNPLVKPVSIGSVTLDNNVLTAPLAGITNLPYRKLLEEFKPGIVYTEMLSATAIAYGGKKTFVMVEGVEEHTVPFGVQLFGSNVEHLVKAAQALEERCHPTIIDLNMACPVRKVIRNNGGASMLTDEEGSARAIEALVKAVKTPVTAKLRIGMKDNAINIFSISKKLEDAGVNAITVHGRTASQMYTGKSNWEIVLECADRISIPVFYSGDLFSLEFCNQVLGAGKLAGIMLARGLFGRPWLIEEVKTGKKMDLPLEECGKVVMRHFDLFISHLGEEKGLKEMRKHLGWYSKGYPAGKEFRQAINQEIDVDNLRHLISQFFRL